MVTKEMYEDLLRSIDAQRKLADQIAADLSETTPVVFVTVQDLLFPKQSVKIPLARGVERATVLATIKHLGGDDHVFRVVVHPDVQLPEPVLRSAFFFGLEGVMIGGRLKITVSKAG